MHIFCYAHIHKAWVFVARFVVMGKFEGLRLWNEHKIRFHAFLFFNYIIRLGSLGLRTFIMAKISTIGQKILDELERQQRNPAWLASQIHCSRTNGYKIIERDNYDIGLLWEISLALNYNFLSDAAEELDAELSKNKGQDVE